MKRPSRHNTPRPPQAPPAQPAVAPAIRASQPWSWVAIGTLCVITLVFFGDLWWRIGVGLGGIYVGAVCLSAVQVLTGLDAGAESIRSGGVSQTFAALFSLPPENVLTLLAPGFFGDMTAVPYWGRGYLWEMSLCISVTGLILALYGAVYADRSSGEYRTLHG